jgi:cytochrome P450/NADPH-cytochrome P450 reductase
MIMVATGTGLAPFRGFLQRREAQGAARGPAFLFFGCRDARHRLFTDELDHYADTGVATVDTAYSEQEGERRVHVQELIERRQEQLWPLLEQGGVVYVCGHAAHVAPAVRQTFAEIFRQKSDASEEEARTWLQRLRDRNRYLEDIWAAA